MVDDESLVDRLFVDVDAYFRTNIWGKGWRKSEPFVVGRESHEDIAIRVRI